MSHSGNRSPSIGELKARIESLSPMGIRFVARLIDSLSSPPRAAVTSIWIVLWFPSSPLGLVTARGGGASGTGPVGMEELTARAVDPLVGMGTEVVALCLDQVGGKAR